MARSSSSNGWPMSPAARSTSRRTRGSNSKPWRWWRKCAGLAAAIGSKIRLRAVRWPRQGDSRRRRHASSSTATTTQNGWCHHRSFAPVYVDELYTHPKSHHVAVHATPPPPQQPITGNDAGKVASRRRNAAAIDAGAKNAGESGKAPRKKATTATATAASNGGKMRGGVRRLVMSPMRGGGVCGMGEVDVRAEMFIRKFREEMRLQSQKSAEEFHAMLARGL
uniref:Uncharacterized protein n=1 Tax=Leersia perrieri TaxID=77586 RepID=A0A0D9X406_9ORYZ